MPTSRSREAVGFPFHDATGTLPRELLIDVYDILESKEDKATVPIYYEGSAPAPGAVNRALAVLRSA